MRFAAATALLLLAACASPPPATAPDWQQLPPLISEAICGRLRAEAISTSNPILIVKTTEPIITGPSVRSVAHLYFKDTEASTLAAALSTGEPMPVLLGSSCAWEPIERLNARKHADRLVLQLSKPFVNPFARSEAGVLARLSIGGHDAQWYWIPLAQRKGRWLIGTVLPMDLHEG